MVTKNENVAVHLDMRTTATNKHVKVPMLKIVEANLETVSEKLQNTENICLGPRFTCTLLN